MGKKAKAAPINTPLEYFEGEMMPVGLKSCWLTTPGGMIVACVSEGPDFEKCRRLLRHAAHCTQAIPDLLAAAIEVKAGLDARIKAASAAGEPVPVFAGIAALHTAIAKAEGK